MLAAIITRLTGQNSDRAYVADGSMWASGARGVRPVQWAKGTLPPDTMWDRNSSSGCASCVAMMQAADHR